MEVATSVFAALAPACALIAMFLLEPPSFAKADLSSFERTRQLDGRHSTGKEPQSADPDKVARIPVNCRRPADDTELEYWLQNMVWHHQFSDTEICEATGLKVGQILDAKRRFGIRADNRPVCKDRGRLRVLPYPGGRHPRTGFLEGAVNPQRETKFSVFPPWDPNSYAVVDLPEAIWSNLGLTYLAHEHIDTIWTKQGLVLERLEWDRHSDGTLDIERRLPNGISFGARVKPTEQAVIMEHWIENGTAKRLTDLRIQICVMTRMMKGFEQQTNTNKLHHDPYIACRSKDGKRWIITAWQNCYRTWANEQCPCFHSDPQFPDLAPGRHHTLRGWFSFYEGPSINEEIKRIELTGWRQIGDTDRLK